MKIIGKLVWRSIRRNPVILLAVTSIVAQFLNDFTEGKVTTENWLTYLGTLILAYIVRSVTVPLKDYKESQEHVAKLGEDITKLTSKPDPEVGSSS